MVQLVFSGGSRSTCMMSVLADVSRVGYCMLFTDPAHRTITPDTGSTAYDLYDLYDLQ